MKLKYSFLQIKCIYFISMIIFLNESFTFLTKVSNEMKRTKEFIFQC